AAHRSGPGQGGPADTPSRVIRPPAARAAESVSERTVGTYCVSRRALESKGLTKRAADARCPREPSQRAPVRPRVLPHPPVAPSNGRAPGGPTARPHGRRRLARTSIAARAGAGSVTPFAADLRS